VKRLVAKRKHKVKCIHCGREILKGDVFYRYRSVFSDDKKYNPHITTFQIEMCAKCQREREQHDIRYNKFQTNCTHPEIFRSYDYYGDRYCELCGQTF
jgi:hypothetical protein